MDNKKLMRIYAPKTVFYLVVILCLCVIIGILYIDAAIPLAVLFSGILFQFFWQYFRKQKEIIRHIENLTLNIDSATKDTLLNFPMPLVVLETDGTISWYNRLFRAFTKDREILDKKIGELIAGIDIDELVRNQGTLTTRTELSGRHYQVLGSFVRTEDKPGREKYLILLYFLDETEHTKLEKRYESERFCAAIVDIDNYDELMQSAEEGHRPQLVAEIDRRIMVWSDFCKGIVKKFEREKYLMIFQHQYLAAFFERRFDILDTIKEIGVGNRIPVTLSIGVGIGGATMAEDFASANASLDLALGRGGDQAVIKDGDAYTFFGGKTRALEKRTKVKARVVSNAISELLAGADNAIVMGHSNPDVDMLGAALGVCRMVKACGRRANVLLNESNPAIEAFLDKIRKDPEYDGLFVHTREALDLTTEKTVLFIVDTHRAEYTEAPELLRHPVKMVLIDHHRMSADYIKDAVLSYHESYASSASELVTELLQYMDCEARLTEIEAETLFAGILIDTKNFTFKTGTRTFEAAAWLRRYGADTLLVKQMLQNDMKSYAERSKIVVGAEVVQGRIAVAVSELKTKEAPLIAAQAADDLLSLTGIAAAFVLTAQGADTLISGRSLGDVNVQVILEKLGGGGHLTEAGTRMKDTAPAAARESLLAAIGEYFAQNGETREERNA